MCFDPSPVPGLSSYLEMTSPHQPAVLSPRCWLEPKFEALFRDNEGLAFELCGSSVKAMTEEDFVGANGGVKHSGKASALAQRWANRMTEKYPELAVADPIFGQLQNCMELAVVGALIVKEGLPEKAGYSMTTLLDSSALKAEEFNSPKEVPTIASIAAARHCRVGRRSDQLLGDRRDGQAQRQSGPRPRKGRLRRQRRLVAELTNPLRGGSMQDEGQVSCCLGRLHNGDEFVPQRRNVVLSRRALLRSYWLLAAMSAALWSCGSPCLAAGDSAATAQAAAERGLAGSRVNVTLQSGKSLKGGTVEEIRPGKIAGTIAQLRVSNPTTGLKTLLGAAAVAQVSGIDGKHLLIFDATSKSLAPPDAESLAAIHKAVCAICEKTGGEAKPQKSTRPTGPHASKSKKGGFSAADRKRVGRKTRPSGSSISRRPAFGCGPSLPTSSRWRIWRSRRRFGQGFRAVFVAEHAPLRDAIFLFLTDLSPQWVPLFTSCLDAMHNELCMAYGIRDKNRVWSG